MKSLVIVIVGSLLISGGFYSCFYGYEQGYNYEELIGKHWKLGEHPPTVMKYKQHELNPYFIIPGMTLGIIGIVVVIIGCNGFLIKMKPR